MKEDDIFTYENALSKAKSHSMLYQYTTIDALKCIIENGSLLLNRLDKVNDFAENDEILALWRKRVFVSCFTHRETESYFFWKTYPEDVHKGVRIALDMHFLENGSIHPDPQCVEQCLGLCKQSDISMSFSPIISSEYWGIYDSSILDVMYIDRNQTTAATQNHQGRIKYSEWDMEEETRIRVALRPRCLELAPNGKLPDTHTPNETKVFLKLSNSCLNAMAIRISPWADESLLDNIMTLLEEHNLKRNQVSRSVLTGEVRSE